MTIQVDEFYLARVKAGQRVDATIDGIPSTLTVSKVYPQVKDGKFEIDLAWEARCPPICGEARRCRASLNWVKTLRPWYCPPGRFWKPLAAHGCSWSSPMFPTAVRRPVKLGRRTTQSVEVLRGLLPGERVITSDYTGLDRIDRLAF